MWKRRMNGPMRCEDSYRHQIFRFFAELEPAGSSGTSADDASLLAAISASESSMYALLRGGRRARASRRAWCACATLSGGACACTGARGGAGTGARGRAGAGVCTTAGTGMSDTCMPADSGASMSTGAELADCWIIIIGPCGPCG